MPIYYCKDCKENFGPDRCTWRLNYIYSFLLLAAFVGFIYVRFMIFEWERALVIDYTIEAFCTPPGNNSNLN